MIDEPAKELDGKPLTYYSKTEKGSIAVYGTLDVERFIQRVVEAVIRSEGWNVHD